MNIPQVETEAVYQSVINKLNAERADHLIQIGSLEQISNKLLEERNDALKQLEELQQKSDESVSEDTED